MRLVAVSIASVALFFPVYWLFESTVGPNWGAGIATAAMFVVFPFLILKMWKAKEVPVANILVALEEGFLVTEDYDVSEAIEVEESEDEGLHFLLDVGEGRTLFLSGQYLYEPVTAGRFPSSRIRIFWNSRENYTFGVETLGDRLLPTRRLPSLTARVLESKVFPNDRDVLAQDLDEVARLLSESA